MSKITKFAEMSEGILIGLRFDFEPLRQTLGGNLNVFCKIWGFATLDLVEAYEQIQLCVGDRLGSQPPILSPVLLVGAATAQRSARRRFHSGRRLDDSKQSSRDLWAPILETNHFR